MSSKYGIAFKKTPAQLVAEVDGLKQDAVTFVLSSKLWRKYSGPSMVLQWDSVPFAKRHRAKVPRKRGVYCFALRPPIKNAPPVLFPLYIGETGNTSGGTLRGRFGQYFPEQTKVKRGHVSYALTKWKKSIHFYFAVVSKGDLKKVEAILNGAYIPPFTHEDFYAPLRKVVSAWRHT